MKKYVPKYTHGLNVQTCVCTSSVCAYVLGHLKQMISCVASLMSWLKSNWMYFLQKRLSLPYT